MENARTPRTVDILIEYIHSPECTAVHLSMVFILQRGAIFILREILFDQSPPRFKVGTLSGTLLPEKYYQEEIYVLQPLKKYQTRSGQLNYPFSKLQNQRVSRDKFHLEVLEKLDNGKTRWVRLKDLFSGI